MQGGDKDELSQSDYNIEFDFNESGKPRFKVTDVKPGEGSSVEDLAKLMVGLAAHAPSDLA